MQLNTGVLEVLRSNASLGTCDGRRIETTSFVALIVTYDMVAARFAEAQVGMRGGFARERATMKWQEEKRSSTYASHMVHWGFDACIVLFWWLVSAAKELEDKLFQEGR